MVASFDNLSVLLYYIRLVSFHWLRRSYRFISFALTRLYGCASSLAAIRASFSMYFALSEFITRLKKFIYFSRRRSPSSSSSLSTMNFRHTTIDFTRLDNDNCIVVVRNHIANWMYFTFYIKSLWIYFTIYLCTIWVRCWFARFSTRFTRNYYLINSNTHRMEYLTFCFSLTVLSSSWMRNFYVRRYSNTQVYFDVSSSIPRFVCCFSNTLACHAQTRIARVWAVNGNK